MDKKVNNKKIVKKCLKKVIVGLLLATIVTTVTYPLTVNAEVKSSATTVKKVSRKNFVKDCYNRYKSLAEVITLM